MNKAAGWIMDQELFDTSLDTAIQGAIKKYQISHSELTERQIASAFKQAILAGDFTRHIRATDDAQCVTYIPYEGVERLRAENARLKERIAELEDQIANVFA